MTRPSQAVHARTIWISGVVLRDGAVVESSWKLPPIHLKQDLQSPDLAMDCARKAVTEAGYTLHPFRLTPGNRPQVQYDPSRGWEIECEVGPLEPCFEAECPEPTRANRTLRYSKPKYVVTIDLCEKHAQEFDEANAAGKFAKMFKVVSSATQSR